MTPIIGDPKVLEMYSVQYICTLYHITDRTTFGSRNAMDVFRKLGLDAFHDEIVAQITDEIVQHLLERRHVKVGNERQVMLTLEGKDWCDNHCKKQIT
jgi:hypothetical protein